jgi:hypothetical protein
MENWMISLEDGNGGSFGELIIVRDEGKNDKY